MLLAGSIAHPNTGRQEVTRRVDPISSPALLACSDALHLLGTNDRRVLGAAHRAGAAPAASLHDDRRTRPMGLESRREC